eukprot:CAMPEP_0174337142 /NCGR_PEP_ID=MMETSP0810-20121108/22066_1 /TAXON_ID=73025 ORGANISM="Eutreptiella gymnastica-like, Strain CCMP1594" /NCGR_SAMPLE_ID=MMETSP0810 /ASSEMBLY_ACC=CAM_ASM_000659 /LENGTH=32 /DNA_ID= /DNA_START= /DNA_END= /DNA_ORIENTATION=
MTLISGNNLHLFFMSTMHLLASSYRLKKVFSG